MYSVCVCVFLGVELEKDLKKQMIIKFGKTVDLEALWKLSANSSLEELKQEKLFREATYDNELDHWDVRVHIVCVCVFVCVVACLCVFMCVHM